MIPQRVRVLGDLFHPRVPAGAIYVGRQAPGLRRSYFHNPFKVGRPSGPLFLGDEPVKDAWEAVELFRQYVSRLGRDFQARAVMELGGRDLACWCREGGPCHVDVLLPLANPDITFPNALTQEA